MSNVDNTLDLFIGLFSTASSTLGIASSTLGKEMCSEERVLVGMERDSMRTDIVII